MNRQQRSFNMSRIRSKNTGIEKICFDFLKGNNVYFIKHYKKVTGKPDIAIPSKKKAVFIHSDFWHGWQYPKWKNRLPSQFWKTKIESNRVRDRKTITRLRKNGWKVLVIWSHELRNNKTKTIKRLGGFVI